MKKILSIIAFLLNFQLQAQSLTEAEKQAIISQIKRELLDSLKLEINSKKSANLVLTDTSKMKQNIVEPFSWGDFSWIQGNNRQSKSLLDSKYFTGSTTIDCNYNYSFNNPIDHTNSGSTATFRSNEFNISYIETGGEFHEPESGARAKLMLQFGSRATGIPRNDNTPLRGQFDLYNALRYVTEGYAGMHFNKLHGINIDFGLFKSYVGLLS